MIIASIFLDLALLRKLQKEYADDLEEISNNPRHIFHYILDGFTYEEFSTDFSEKLATLTSSYDEFASGNDFYKEIHSDDYRAVSYYYYRGKDNEGLLILIDKIPEGGVSFELTNLFPIMKRSTKFLVFSDNQTYFLENLVKKIVPTYQSYIGILNSFDFEGIKSLILLQGVQNEYKRVILQTGKDKLSNEDYSAIFQFVLEAPGNIANWNGKTFVKFHETSYRAKETFELLIEIDDQVPDFQVKAQNLAQARQIFEKEGLHTAIIEKILLLFLGNKFRLEPLRRSSETIYPMTSTYIYRNYDLDTIFQTQKNTMEYLGYLIEEFEDFRVILTLNV